MLGVFMAAPPNAQPQPGTVNSVRPDQECPATASHGNSAPSLESRLDSRYDGTRGIYPPVHVQGTYTNPGFATTYHTTNAGAAQTTV